ncbi:hypothetical protein Rctr197k_138 [Virus Rctr197k]|nr:hypothetical protein Rctr197k_138 [Virus Rctr197k]
MKLSFESFAPSILGAFVPDLIREPGRAPRSIRLRIDSRTPGNVRVDVWDVAVWVAIDDGRGFKSVESARRFAERWAGAARRQQTSHPRIER